MFDFFFRGRLAKPAMTLLVLVLVGCRSAAPVQLEASPLGADFRAATNVDFKGEYVAGGDFGADHPRYSPDGRNIAFTAKRGGRSQLAIVPAAGGPPTFLTSGPSDMHPAWSPDGKRLVYVSHPAGEANLHTINAEGGDPIRITHSSAAKVGPDWSPDGKMIIYSSNEGGNWNIWSVPASGGTPRKLTTHTGDEWSPRHSPDGRFILFSTNWGENANIDAWMIPAAAGEPIRLTSGLDDEVTPAWSPDGRRIAFFTDLGGLFVMSLASGERTSIAPGEGFHDILSWSRDGRWIVASRNPEPFGLFEVTLEAGEPRPLALRKWNVWTPDVSRRAGAIAFSRMDEDGNGDVWVLPSGGVQPNRLTIDMAPDLHPSWSPDGKRIAFVSRRDRAHNGDIWVMSADGAAAKRWTTLRSAHRPRWCDGHLIVFQSDRVEDGQHHIFSIASGRTPKQLTSGTRETDPECVPATQQILYSGAVKQGSELFRLPLTGGEAIQLTAHGAWARFPRASPDGSRIAFLSNKDGSSEIFVMPMSGGPARRLTSDKGEKSPPAWAPDGRSIIYSVKAGESQIRRYQVPPGAF